MSFKEYSDFMEKYAQFQDVLGIEIENLIEEFKEEVLEPVADGVVNPGDLEEIADRVFEKLSNRPNFYTILKARQALLKQHIDLLKKWANLPNPQDLTPLLAFETKAAIVDSLRTQFEESEMFEINLDD